MVIDYRTQKPVNRNRPKRQPASIFFFSLFVAVLVSYTLGLATGWLVFSSDGEKEAENGTSFPDAVAKSDEAAQGGKEGVAPENTAGVKEPMLTFYETLPKGNRELIGSGLNLPKPVATLPARVPPLQKEEAAAKPPAPPAQQPQTKEEPKALVKSVDTAPVKEATTRETPAKERVNKPAEPKTLYTVQVASYHDRNEAEELRDRMKANGLPAYLVESRIQDKGVFYRVRVGRRLEQKSAQELMERVGKGAMVIPE